MKRSEFKENIPIVLAKLHSEGEPAAYYSEISHELVQMDSRYLAKRAAIRDLLSKVGIDFPIIPSSPLVPGAVGPGKIYPALDLLERKGIVEGFFQPEPGNGRPPRKVYRLMHDLDTIQD